MKNIFISFVEEAVLNPDYEGYIGGRIEVSRPGDVYQSEEIRFFTKDVEGFNRFRDKCDMREVSEYGLRQIRDIVNEKWNK